MERQRPLILDPERALAFYRRGFTLAASSTIVEAEAWLEQEQDAVDLFGAALHPLIDEARAAHEAETGCCAFCGHRRHDIDDDF